MNQLEMYLNILRKGWLIILATFATAVIIAFLASVMTTATYRTTARFIVSPDRELFSESDLLRRGLDTLDRDSIISTYAEVFDSSRMRNSAREALGLENGSLGDYSVSAVALPNTNVLELAVEGTDPETVASLANAIGEQSIIFLEDLYVLYDITLLDEARIPTNPISPATERNVGVAAILGLFGGLGLAFLYTMYDAQRTADEASQHSVVQPASSAD
ncbi:MAG: Wzz/FepE/Etk N-terminal domain-containing protein [Ardenticatenaceae bacterium]|nr:Wzz/FepE/Etk N-terminal domain-containing protein [Ardenticatenaceae bacterium]